MRGSSASRAGSTELLHREFQRQARATPGAVALVEGDEAVTFAELAHRVETLVGGLRNRGIGAGTAVGLRVDRSMEWVVAILAILEAGAAVVPLPPSDPVGRLAEILDCAGPEAVLATGPPPDGLPAEVLGSTRWLALEDVFDVAERSLSEPQGDPEDLAFILCSSGSTGRPKMIARSHRSFFHRLRWTWSEHPFEAGERCCQKSHMTTTHAVYELFEPLLQGVPVVILSDGLVRDLERFWTTIRQERVTRLLIVPAQLQASLIMADFRPPPLKVLVLMGEYVSPALAEEVLGRFPPSTAIYSIYGSTEASSTLVCDLRREHRTGRELPLGRPISADISVSVLDPEGRPVEEGEVGRLHVAGPALFHGYFRDPELTASVCVGGPDPREWRYDTGDRVRQTPEGSLEFVGRVDHTVKVRGFRVDLKEVEDVLLSWPDVAQAAVLKEEGPDGTARLRAFLAPATLEAGEAYDFVRSRLPEYMVPARVEVLPELPRTASGKVDRRRLQEMDVSGGAVGALEELSATERELADVCCRILGLDGVPMDRSYFELGGTSLSAFVLVHRLRERFDLDREALDVDTIYRLPTMGELAAHLDRVRDGRRPQRALEPSALVPFREGRDPTLPPLFLIAPAGGALGSYGALVRALRTPRDIIGVRDPFHWGARDPRGGFDAWVALYLEAIRRRRPSGPYHLLAYSSGAPFAYELARRLRHAGERVDLLALVEPLGMDRGGRTRYGWWVMKAAAAPRLKRTLIRLMGRLRWKAISTLPGMSNLLDDRASKGPEASPRELMEKAVRTPHHILSLSALLELNTGVPYALERGDLREVPPERYLEVLKERVRALTPEVDLEALERVVLQYPLQVKAQESYRLRPYDGDVLVVEVAAPYAGLMATQLRPYVRALDSRTLPLGDPEPRTLQLAERWGPTAPHFLSMRNDRFVEGLAKELDALLG